ncbi:hypothetical protein C8J56DRAFT_970910 [Mycena floridula]|nr:hypothetical protein C8J56DRAFT_970910 [Mycena floridula]
MSVCFRLSCSTPLLLSMLHITSVDRSCLQFGLADNATYVTFSSSDFLSTADSVIISNKPAKIFDQHSDLSKI